MPRIMLDHIEGICLDDTVFPFERVHALEYLPRGLLHLATEVRRREREKAQEDPRLTFTWEPENEESGLLACYFSWFASSLVNYLSLIALVKLAQHERLSGSDLADPVNHKRIARACKAYVKGIIPDVLLWRHKVAGHFAATDPRSEDNLPTLELSAMNSVAFRKPYYRAAAMGVGIGNETSELTEWALTETLERLAPRIAPDLKLDPIP